jgi:hypothetical protein
MAYEEEQEDETVKLILMVRTVIADPADYCQGDWLLYSTDSVFDRFKRDDDFSWMEKKTMLTRRLKKLGIRVKPKKSAGSTKKFYAVNIKLFEDFANRYLPRRDQSETVTNGDER